MDIMCKDCNSKNIHISFSYIKNIIYFTCLNCEYIKIYDLNTEKWM